MATGLQVIDANNNVLFDSTYNTTRILGNFDTGTSDGSLSVPNITGTLWAVMNYSYNPSSLINKTYRKQVICKPIVSVRGNTISWKFLNPDDYIDGMQAAFGYGIVVDFIPVKISVNVLYGVYL